MEKRKHVRHATYKQATIFIAPATRGIACHVMDISEGGVGLHVASGGNLPDTFDMLIQGETKKRPCKVAWKQGKKLGVAFQTQGQAAGATATSAESKRMHPRRQVTDRGKIVINRPFSMVDCIVLDISEGGACLEVALPVQLPPSFELVFAERRRACSVAWKNQKRIGVAFK